jgi:hypothetical protein
MTADQMLEMIRDKTMVPVARTRLARELLERVENYWCPECKEWRKLPVCAICHTETQPGMSMYAQLDTINELRGILNIEEFQMKKGPNWIEIMPATWVNLRRINIIQLKGGGAISLDGETYNPSKAVIDAIERWLGQRELKTG